MLSQKEKYLIVGLGNPDKEYLDTFHNVGFMCVDKAAQKLSAKFTKGECRALTAHITFPQTKIILAKPITYMNLSGEAVYELVKKYKIEKDKCLIIYDDADLPLGELRLRQKGSGGTHNGMKHIVAKMGTEEIFRMRIGIGKAREGDLASFVLSKLRQEDKTMLENAFERGAQAVVDFVKGETYEKVMLKFN